MTKREIKIKRNIAHVFTLLVMVIFTSVILSGCGSNEETGGAASNVPTPAPAQVQQNEPHNPVNIDVEDDDTPTRMVSYDVNSIGRGNPFMPYGEAVEYEKARNSAIAEANAKNARIIRIKRMRNYAVREADDISPYSFNLPVPPTSLATGSYAAKITKTKVVGIMYNAKSPSAIINVDNKDYLVRPGDKIIGQEYKVSKISPSWVTATMGSNVYSAAIGELFSKDKLQTNQTDIYNLKERFGGRKI